jgi:predicted adenylyl cyclase CyaB
MPRNLELKASYRSLVKALRIAEELGARREGSLRQTDTYFLSGSDRLKLREIRGDHAELIFYRRPNTSSVRYSEYSVVRVPEPARVKRLFSKLFGIRVVVVKKRILYIYKNARIHIDLVPGLGNFIEFEVLVLHGRKQAELLMAFLKKEFQIREASIIGGSYSDILLGRKRLGIHRA